MSATNELRDVTRIGAKHTPGPWQVVPDGVNGDWPNGCEIAIDDARGLAGERDYYLASVVHGDPDELLANARLVAAAPELYEALRVMVERMERTGRDVENELDKRITASARAALAKVEGGPARMSEATAEDVARGLLGHVED
jgi:hypothetical protein